MRESNSTKSSITNTRQNLAQNQHKQAHQKSGGFIGFELGFGLANTKISQNHQNLLSDKTYATLPLNLSFGYLWYFSRSMGLRFSGFIGTSSYSNEMLKHNGRDVGKVANGTGGYYDENGKQISPNYDYEGNYEYVINVDSSALQYGVEISYVWDFYTLGKHSYGFSLDIAGIWASTYFPKMRYKYQSTRQYKWASDKQNLCLPELCLANNFTESREAKNTLNFETHTKIAYSTGLGFYYAYKSTHQISLSYKYHTYSDKAESKLKNIDTFSEFRISNLLYLSNISNHSLMLGYVYRF